MFKKLDETAILPMAKTKRSAGFDICTIKDFTIYAGETLLIKTGIALDTDSQYEYLLRERAKSGIFFDKQRWEFFLDSHYFDLKPISRNKKKGLSFLSDGTIDLDYKEEIGILIHNHNREGFIKFKKGDAIGQLILAQHSGLVLDNYILQAERSGGWGSTNEN